jgi:hypothetical protein
MTSNVSRTLSMNTLPSATTGSARGSRKVDLSQEMVPAGLDDLSVDLDEPGLLDGVFEDLEAPAVPAADDEDLGRPRVRGHGRVDEHLVVVELVALGRLDEPSRRRTRP